MSMRAVGCNLQAESYHPTRIEMSRVRRIGSSMSMRAVGCQPTG